MNVTIETSEVHALIERGAQLVDVLPADTFAEEHLPGAVNIPLAEIGSATDTLDRTRPVIVYCYDYECDLSPRAAAHLRVQGFEVYDYVASKVAWLAEGLPGAGRLRDDGRAGSKVRTDKPVLPADATVAELRKVEEDAGFAVIVDDDYVVLGTVRIEAQSLPDTTPLNAIMHTAPPSVRPSIPVGELAQSMDKNGESHVLITTLRGTLIGVVGRQDLARG